MVITLVGEEALAWGHFMWEDSATYSFEASPQSAQKGKK